MHKYAITGILITLPLFVITDFTDVFTGLRVTYKSNFIFQDSSNGEEN